MVTVKRGILLLMFITALFLCSCGGGGGGTITPPDTNDPGTGVDDPGDTTGDMPTAADFSEWSAGQDLSNDVRVARGIPPVPRDATASSTTSDVGDHSVLGSDALDFSLCTVEGTTMLINSHDEDIEMTADTPAWALYRISGLADARPESLNVECQPGGYGQVYSVAVADYTTLEWRWYGPVNFPEAQVDLTGDNHEYVTNLGNLYFLVVCYGENTATHHRSTVVTGGPGTGDLPGAPDGLLASKGEFADGVGLVWVPGRGAEHYEVWRKFAEDWGGIPEGPGPMPGPGPDNAEWEMIATTESPEYFDNSAVPGVIYRYKARSVNVNGESRFSNIDEGWAHIDDPWDPEFDGIHGYVWAHEMPNPGMPGGYFGGRGGPDPGTGGGPGDPEGMMPPPLEPMPLADVDLYLQYFNPDGPVPDVIVAQATTNEDGFYQFGDVDPGEYILRAQKEGWIIDQDFIVFVPEDFPEMPQQFDFHAFPEDRNPWEPGDGVHGFVMGEFFHEDGMVEVGPLADVLVRVIDIENDEEIAAEAYTDAEGHYEFLDLLPGDYMITAEKEEWNFEPPMHFLRFDDQMPPMCFDFWGWKGDPPLPPNPPQPEFEGIFGWVHAEPDGNDPPPPPGDPGGPGNPGDPGDPGDPGNPGDPPPPPGDPEDPTMPPPVGLAGVTISIEPLEMDTFAPITLVTDEEGFFHWPEAPGGDYIVTAELEGWNIEPPEHMVFVDDSGYSWPIDFWAWQGDAPGPNPPPRPPVMIDGIEGFVFGERFADGQGDGLFDVMITVEDAETGNMVEQAFTDEDGFFAIPEIADGEYLVSADKDGWMFEPEAVFIPVNDGQSPHPADFFGFQL